jgi:PAS domain S-box-containing protein
MEHFSFQENENIEDAHLLGMAIDSFNGAASRFEKHYQHLEQRVKELKIQLRNKNEVLEKNLNEKEEVKNHLHNILESVTTGVVVVNLKGKITTFNCAAENITGLASKRVLGKKLDKIFDLNFFQNIQLDFRPLGAVRENAEYETEIYRKGEDLVHISLSISPLTTPQGQKTGLILTLQDITQMKKLEEQASRSGRLAAMGEMAVKIAHEIRNPLGSIELFASTLKKDLEDFEEPRVLSEHISSCVKSINSIISNLLLFMRPEQKAGFQIVDLHDPLKDSLFFSDHVIQSNEHIEVITSYYSEPLMVLGDSELLKQMYLNLILNAVQSMPDDGKLMISTDKIECPQNGPGFAEIRFMDTGTGISKAVMPRIFDPFFTTKKRGTGLGLAIVHNIIKLHGGSIDIRNSKKDGAVCIVTLPLVETR